MSSKTLKRRNSAHHKPKPSRLKSKKSKAKRYSTNSMKLRSLPNKPRKYSSHTNLHKIHIPNNENNGYHAESMIDSNDFISRSSDNETPRPTHKKNAVSSFFSIFSTINKRRKDSTQSSDAMSDLTDLELLKRLKRRILDILCKIIGIAPFHPCTVYTNNKEQTT